MTLTLRRAVKDPRTALLRAGRPLHVRYERWEADAVARRRREEQRLRDASVQPSWTTGPPNFVGIGVQRGGTTWWADLISAHPDVVLSTAGKEAHFFHPFWSDNFTENSIADYHHLFPRPAGAISGEWSPDYFWYEWTPSLLVRAAPSAQLLLMLRDPVERYRSGFAIGARSTTAPPNVAQIALERGLYGEQLRRWLRWFAREQILVLQYERCVREPAGELARTFEFLGVDPDYVPDDVKRIRSPTGSGKAPLPPEVHALLRERYAEDANLLRAIVPELDFNLWPSASAGAP